MRRLIKEISIVDKRPFSYRDFLDFELDSNKYGFSHGTIRNYLSKLTKSGEVILAYNSGIAFYTLPGKKFEKGKTPSHTGVPPLLLNPVITNRPIYKWLKNRPFEKQALHKVRATFQANSIWTLFKNSQLYHVNEHNLDILLPSSKCLEDLNIDLKIAIHHTDTVSVAIGCSSGPLSIEAEDIFRLIEVLSRVENHIADLKNICLNTLNSRGNQTINLDDSQVGNISIPRFTTWIAKMWHFGIDSIDEYGSKEFHVTLDEGVGDLYRIYTKRKKGKLVVRVEHQEYPNETIEAALLKKWVKDGTLPWRRS